MSSGRQQPESIQAANGSHPLKQVQRQWLSADECRALLADLLQLPLRLTSASELACGALDQAMALSLSVYDASYLALALKHGARLITADKQLAKAALSLGCLADPAFPE